MVTIKDIAKVTGVSCTTVSNVIHGRSSRVSPITVKKINRAIQELGYVPNMSARTLISSSSRVIAYINHIGPTQDPEIQDPFQSSIINTVEAMLRQNGYYMMLRAIDEPDDLLSFLRTWSIDGLIFTGVFLDRFYDVVKNLKIPMVLIDSYIKQPDVSNIGLDDFQGSFDATAYLLQHGHRKISFASPSIRDGGVLKERFLGYKTALAEYGVPFDQTLIIEHEMDYHSSRQAGIEIASLPDVTAVVVTADIMAAGIMTGIREYGKRIPEDISIIGFDDIEISRLTTPALTTIHQDIQKKGKLAVHTLLQLLDTPNAAPTSISLPTRLIERESVRQLKEPPFV